MTEAGVKPAPLDGDDPYDSCSGSDGCGGGTGSGLSDGAGWGDSCGSGSDDVPEILHEHSCLTYEAGGANRGEFSDPKLLTFTARLKG